MQLQHVFAAGRLMQSVDILRYNGAQLALALQLRKAQMRTIGLHAVDNELCPMKPVILLRVTLKEAVAQNCLRRVLPLLIIQAVNAAEIRYPALGADSCAAEKHDIVALRDPFFKLVNLSVHRPSLHSTPVVPVNKGRY